MKERYLEEPISVAVCTPWQSSGFSLNSRERGQRFPSQISFASFYRFNGLCFSDNRRPLLVILFSGFRASFLSPETTPILWKLKECGTSADSLRPVYPATSFPNQYTVATGLYPESHGIVDDVFRDGDSGNLFNSQDSSTNSLPEWWKGEAIWITAKKQGKRVNIHSWAGSEVCWKIHKTLYRQMIGKDKFVLQVPQQGTRPDVVLSSNSASSLRSQIEKAVEWLSVDNADLVMLQREAPRLAGMWAGNLVCSLLVLLFSVVHRNSNEFMLHCRVYGYKIVWFFESFLVSWSPHNWFCLRTTPAGIFDAWSRVWLVVVTKMQGLHRSFQASFCFSTKLEPFSEHVHRGLLMLGKC